MNITEEQFIELIALLSEIETSGRINFVPVLGLSGAEEAFFTIQEFVAQLDKQALAKEKTLQALHSENERLGLYKDAYAQPEQEPSGHFLDFAYSDSIAYVHVYDQFRKGQQFYKAPPQPEQEPVTWGVDWGKAGDISCVSIIKRLPNGGIEVVAVEYAPYSYTTPPQRTWVGLTDDEISALSKGHIVRSTYARAIEAKLKERNT
jgi:hypothetical protein